jgi:hypothetical protein
MYQNTHWIWGASPFARLRNLFIIRSQKAFHIIRRFHNVFSHQYQSSTCSLYQFEYISKEVTVQVVSITRTMTGCVRINSAKVSIKPLSAAIRLIAVLSPPGMTRASARHIKLAALYLFNWWMLTAGFQFLGVSYRLHEISLSRQQTAQSRHMTDGVALQCQDSQAHTG